MAKTHINRKKSAHPQDADERKGINRGDYVIIQFIFMGRTILALVRLFLADKFLPNYVEAVFASRRLPPKAAVTVETGSSLFGHKERRP